MAQYHVILSLAKGGAWDGAPVQKEPSQLASCTAANSIQNWEKFPLLRSWVIESQLG